MEGWRAARGYGQAPFVLPPAPAERAHPHAVRTKQVSRMRQNAEQLVRAARQKHNDAVADALLRNSHGRYGLARNY